MLFRWRLSLAYLPVLGVALCVFLSGCKPPKRTELVEVRIFHNLPFPYDSELDHRILDFQATNPRLADGTPIEVGNLTLADLRSAVKDVNDPAVEIVVLNSPADASNFPALQGELAHAINVCAAVGECPADVPAFVPSKLQGERAEAANKFVQFLATAKPTPANPEPAPAQSQPAPPPSGH